MNSRQKILAVINPISGTHKKEHIPEMVREKLSAFDVTTVFTQRQHHAYELAEAAVSDGLHGVIAIGGDGTINEVASALCNSNTALAIVPNGSGNGLARHLHIPLDLEKSLDIISQNHIEEIDYCTANSRPFFCTCGVGFDASVSNSFAKGSKRGAFGYVKSAIIEYLKYRCDHYRITTSEGVLSERAFIVACGNASQYGNNAYIAPNADIHDGLIDVTVVLPITPLDTAMLGLLLFSRHIDQDTNIISLRTSELTIERSGSGAFHLDGETLIMPEKIHICCHHKGIKAFTPIIKETKPTILNTIENSFWDFINSVRKELNI